MAYSVDERTGLMSGRASEQGEVPESTLLAVARAHEMEERLHIDRLPTRLPATRSLGGVAQRIRARAARPSTAPRSTPSSADGALRWFIATAATSDRLAARWGDWHFASALARALERRGHVGMVRTRERYDEAVASQCDVAIVVRGLVPAPRRLARRHVLWIISHPESITRTECEDADLVLVASEPFADHLRERTDTPVEVMLQASDPVRFRPLAPDARYRHPIVVVAKTRDVQRAAVTDAISAGLRPAVYGTGWRDLIDPSMVIADYVPNAELPILYSSAGVVLNDHWPSMREWGFVSNRLFDLMACGTPAVSDAVPGIETLFGKAVGMYLDPPELRSLVEERLADPDGARQKVAPARQRGPPPPHLRPPGRPAPRARGAIPTGRANAVRPSARRVGSARRALESPPVPNARWIRRSAFVAAAALVLASGCSRGGSKNESATKDTSAPKSFTIWAPDRMKKPLDSAVQYFKTLQPDIEISVVYGGEELNDRCCRVKSPTSWSTPLPSSRSSQPKRRYRTSESTSEWTRSCSS